MGNNNLEEKELERYGVWVRSGPDGRILSNIAGNEQLDLVEIEGEDPVYISEEEEKQLEGLEEPHIESRPKGEDALEVDTRLKTDVPDADISSDSILKESTEGSSSVLSVIEEDLKSLRSEIHQLRNEIIKMREPDSQQSNITDNSAQKNSFFDEEDDETIVLSDSELNQVLDSADMRIESAPQQTDEDNPVSDDESPLESINAEEELHPAIDDEISNLELDENINSIVNNKPDYSQTEEPEIESLESLETLENSNAEEELHPAIDDEISNLELDENINKIANNKPDYSQTEEPEIEILESLETLENINAEEELQPAIDDEISNLELDENINNIANNKPDYSQTEEPEIESLESLETLENSNAEEELHPAIDDEISNLELDENINNIANNKPDYSQTEEPEIEILESLETLENSNAEEELHPSDEFPDIPSKIQNEIKENAEFDEGEELEIDVPNAETDIEGDDSDSDLISLSDLGFNIDEIENPEINTPEDQKKTSPLNMALGQEDASGLEENLKAIEEIGNENNSDANNESEKSLPPPEPPLADSLSRFELQEDDTKSNTGKESPEDTPDEEYISLKLPEKEETDSHDKDQNQFLAMADEELHETNEVSEIEELHEIEKATDPEIIDYSDELEDLPGTIEFEPESLDNYTTPEPIDSSPEDFSQANINEEEIRDILQYMDSLLESLPKEKIQEFSESRHFEAYKKIFEELGIAD